MKGRALYERARRRMPGGTQLLSKRPELYLPDGWPSYYASARGVEVVDLDGRRFIDMSMMGIGACVIGYADPDVDQAVRSAIAAGVQCTLNAPDEVELADLLCELHPWADMVRFARAGGEAMAIAVRLARAATGRDRIAFSGYHGWSDWYLAANLGESSALDGHLMPGLDPAGVPRTLGGSALPFHYNRIEELEAIVARHRGEIAGIVMEPQRNDPPRAGFLEAVRNIARDIGAVLIFDEITTGFRAATGGVHRRLGVDPDLAVFAKAMANGYAMAAVIGRGHVMQAAQSTFISSTNWTERIGPAAALATIRKLRHAPVIEHIERIGRAVMTTWRDEAARTGIPLTLSSHPSLAHFHIDDPNEPALTTLFTQEMLDRGFLAYNQFKPSFAHTDEHVARYRAALAPTFDRLAIAMARGDAASELRGPVARRSFYRLT